MGLFGQSASGHAALISVTPPDGSHLDSSPTEIVLEFSEPVGIVENGTLLFQQDAEQQALTPVADDHKVHIPIDDELVDGAYVVQWRVISADSHPIAGTVSFTVGDANHTLSIETETLPGWVENARIVAAAVKYLGLLTAFGVLVFGWLVARGDWFTTKKLATGLFCLAMAGALLEIPCAAMVQSGHTLGFGQQLWDAYEGLDSGYRASAVVLVSLLAIGIVGGRLKIGVGLQFGLMLALAGGAGLSQVLSGHSRTKEPVWLMMLSDSVHILVAGIWLGGLLVLTLGLLGKWKGSAFETDEGMAAAVSRFSTLAGWSLLLVAVSGVTMGVIILRSLDALLDTNYGKTLMIKTALVGIVVAMAAVNRFLLIPRIARSATPTIPWLRRLVSVELVVLLVVVVVTARLVQLNPNIETVVAEQNTSASLYSGEVDLDANHSAHIMVERADRHQYRVTAHLLGPGGEMLQTGEVLNVNWFMPEQNLGPIVQSLELQPDGSYAGELTLSFVGAWQMEVRASFDRFTDSRATIELVIPE